ncbi:MAG TPA: response regulator [Candidatus Acidoferrum sp.]|nr:response regulator [Candidatus Acidoferrum sp.]
MILLVEDNEDDIFFMQRAFEKAELTNPLHVIMDGHEAINYLDGRGGFADRAAHPFPDFIFLDLKLPFVDGFEVLTWLRQEKKSSVPVAVLSSSPEEVDMRRARELGASCYLIKPPDVSMLLSCWKQFSLS